MHLILPGILPRSASVLVRLWLSRRPEWSDPLTANKQFIGNILITGMCVYVFCANRKLFIRLTQFYSLCELGSCKTTVMHPSMEKLACDSEFLFGIFRSVTCVNCLDDYLRSFCLEVYVNLVLFFLIHTERIIVCTYLKFEVSLPYMDYKKNVIGDIKYCYNKRLFRMIKNFTR